MDRRQAPKHVGVRLPKVLQEELVSLGIPDEVEPKIDPAGKLKPHAKAKGQPHAKPPSKYGPKPVKRSPYIKKDTIEQSVKAQTSNAPGTNAESSNEDEEIDEESREIAYLERKLGIKDGRAKPAECDGLDDFLDGILGPSAAKKRKNNFDDGRSSLKFRIADAEEDYESEKQLTSQSKDSKDSNADVLEEESEFKGFSDSDDSKDNGAREVPSGRYIPPAARKAQENLSTHEEDPRLRKQLQGMLNRLSEANMSTILSETEALYRSHPRADVTSILSNILLSLLTAQHTLLDTFVILHAGFVAALYRVIGLDFGAYLVQTLVGRFDALYGNEGKDALNLVVLLTELYNFGVIGAGLVFDFVRMCLQRLDEFDTEMLLKIVQNSGEQLRQDDPSALKEIVILMQSRIDEAGQSNLSVRTKFMVETIINLKNNRAKAATSSSVLTSEATIRMKKFLGKLNEKGLRTGGEALRVTLEDIRNVKEKGKWWLVGASWKNDDISFEPIKSKSREEDDALLTLARGQRMNTEIRRAVFIAVMGAEDYIDASTRILLLPLKKAQRNEIARVLVHCCSSESHYNPFYGLVAKRLCSSASTSQVARVVRMGLQFNLWGAFREWGEMAEGTGWTDEQDDFSDAEGKLRKSLNLAKLYGFLVAENVVSLQALKVLGFVNLQPLTKTFLELFFTQLIVHSQGDDVTSRNAEPLLDCVDKVADNHILAKGIDWYLRKKNIEKAGLSTGEEKECVAWGISILRKGIAAITRE